MHIMTRTQIVRADHAADAIEASHYRCGYRLPGGDGCDRADHPDSDPEWRHPLYALPIPEMGPKRYYAVLCKQHYDRLRRERRDAPDVQDALFQLPNKERP
jgi:hypothetical protein